jgi:hypothetical protein
MFLKTKNNIGGLKKELNKVEQLMHDLIFDKKVEYEIDLTEYISEITDAEEFTNEIVNNLIKSGIKIVEQVIILVKDKKTWILKIKRD